MNRRQLKKIIKEELKRMLISEYDDDGHDTSAAGSFSSEWETVEVYLGGVLGGMSVYQPAPDGKIEASNLLDWLEEDAPQLAKLGLDEWDTSDREELADNIRNAIEEGNEQGKSW